MKNNLSRKRIPVFLALISLIAVVLITIILVQRGILIVGRAAPDKKIDNFSITNITDTSFTVIFTTNQQTGSVISLNLDDTKKILILDDRDKPRGEESPYYSHHITVPNLIPETRYEFSIISGGKIFTNNDSDYTVTTAPTINVNPPDQNPLFGSILLTTGEIGKDVLVTAQISGSQIISSVTKDKGEFIIPTNSMRKETLDDYFIITNNPKITINAIRQNTKADITATFEQALSLPPIVLSESYDFVDKSVDSQIPLSSQLEVPTLEVGDRKIALIVPKDKETFIDSRPLFSGTAFPITPVTITIPDQNIVSKIISNIGGSWTFRPETNLSVGQHTISIESKDNIGIVNKLSREFTILASGSQVAQSATPSATPVITSTPTPTIQPTVTITLTPTKTVPTPTISFAPSPTASISSIPTLIPTSTLIPSIVDPGSLSSTLALTGLSIIFIIAGAALLFAL